MKNYHLLKVLRNVDAVGEKTYCLRCWFKENKTKQGSCVEQLIQHPALQFIKLEKSDSEL